MFSEANAAQKFFKEKFGENPVEPGAYPVPYSTARGEAFMKIVVDEQQNMSDFHLFWDEGFTISWYTKNPDGTPRSMPVDNVKRETKEPEL